MSDRTGRGPATREPLWLRQVPREAAEPAASDPPARGAAGEAAGAAAGAPPREAGAAAAPRRLTAGVLELLVLQPSAFCNLDCDYCYLPHRTDRARMPLDRLDRVMAEVMASGLAGDAMSVVWHAGEPMAVPRTWYEDAFEIVARHAGRRRVTHHFQTNGVLIDAAWCAFFLRHGVRVGVSVDGPAPLHDLHRRTRDGRGTPPARWPASHGSAAAAIASTPSPC